MIKLVRGYVPSTSPAADWHAGYNEFIREYQNSTDEKVARCFKYFQQQWAPNTARWAKALRANCSYGGSDTTGAIESYHRVVKDAMKADNKIKINQRRIDWFLYFFVNTLLPYFCEREIDGERDMDVRTRKGNMDMFVNYNDLKAEGAFQIIPRTSKDAGFSAKIKYLGQVHTVTNLHAINEAAETRTHKCISCDCYHGGRGELCLPKIHAMMDVNDGACMTALGMQPKNGQTLKEPERRHSEHKVFDASTADTTIVGRELMKSLDQMHADVFKVLGTCCVENMLVVNRKLQALSGLISGFPAKPEQGQASLNETEDATYSSVHSVRYSMGMHRVGAASGKTSSHTTTRQKSLAERCAPNKRKRTDEPQ